MTYDDKKTTEYSASDILQHLLSSGSISMDDVAAEMNKRQKEKMLKAHPYPITCGKDGRYRTYIKEEGQARRQIAKSTYEAVLEVLYEFYKDKIPGLQPKPTVESLYPKWFKLKELHAAAPTYLKRIQSNWKNWYEGKEIIKRPVDELTKLDMDIFLHELIQDVNQKKKEFYNISMIMRQVLDYAVDAEIIEKNPMRKVRVDGRHVFVPEKKKKSETQVFTREEVAALHKVAWKDFETDHMSVHKLAPLAFLFQFQTGVRIGELVAVRYEDVLDGEIYINRMYRHDYKEIVEYTKGHHDGRYIVLTKEAEDLIATAKAYQQEHGLDDSGYIFSINDEPLSYYAIRKLYARYCDEIGTVGKSSHKARKTYISALIDGGVNINTIRDMVGHMDERTTYNSYCYDRRPKKERVALIERALS